MYCPEKDKKYETGPFLIYGFTDQSTIFLKK
jgi:hypothetical protein